MSEQALENHQEQAIVQYKGIPITITFDDINKYICPLATPKEVAIFLKTCQSLQLNPFASEIYLIKYSPTDKAAQVIAIDSYLKAAEVNDNYDGHEAGVILKESAGKLEERQGAFLLDEERDKLVGGWARVYRKDRARPFYISVHKNECIRFRKDGTLTEFWQEKKQPWMLRKVALSRALVEAFPSLFAGLTANVEYEEFPEEVVAKLPKPKGEMVEGQEPQAFYKNGKSDWSLFWTRVKKELELTPDEIHAHFGVPSLTELLEGGKTLDEIWTELVALARKKSLPAKEEKETTIPTQEPLSLRETGEEELFPEEEPEIPVINEDLLKGWEIVKSSIKELKVTDRQIRNWFKHYNLEVSLADFDNRFPPAEVTNDILSKFEDSLQVYRRGKGPD